LTLEKRGKGPSEGARERRLTILNSSTKKPPPQGEDAKGGASRKHNKSPPKTICPARGPEKPGGGGGDVRKDCREQGDCNYLLDAHERSIIIKKGHT